MKYKSQNVVPFVGPDGVFILLKSKLTAPISITAVTPQGFGLA